MFPSNTRFDLFCTLVRFSSYSLLYNLAFSEILEYVRNHESQIIVHRLKCYVTWGNANSVHIYFYLFEDTVIKSRLYTWNRYTKWFLQIGNSATASGFSLLMALLNIRLEGLGENINIRNISFFRLHSKRAPPGCSSEILPLEPNCLVTHYPITYEVIIKPMLTLTV